MDKYKKLISNTLIFAIGTFSSKVLVILLLPLYTSVLTESDYGIVNALIDTANLIIPLVSIGISAAIIRFGLDRAYDKRDVFTGGLTAIGIGYALFLVAHPFFGHLVRTVSSEEVPLLPSHINLVYLYVLTSCLRSLCSQFVRAKEFVKLYALDGVFSTVTVILFNILFLVVFKLGIVGYILATILSDLLSASFLFWIAGLRRYIRLRRMDWSVLGSMARYCVPLIPNSISWWITNASGRYIVIGALGAAAAGLYSVSYKIPTMINLVSGIFTDAWQMSAFTEGGPGRDRFFSNVFAAYQALVFTAASGLIFLCKPIMHIVVAKAFFPAWRYIPFLVMATTFSCFVTFLGSIYMVEKKSVSTLVTTMVGAGLNILLCVLLIKKFGCNGAAFASFASYFLVYIIRAVDTHRYVRIRWNLPKLLLNIAILLTQCWVLLRFQKGWLLPEFALCAAVILLNFKQLLMNAQKILRKRRPRGAR